jgi:predicted ATPase/DNA-binding SARP family transcriptional activator
VLELRILGPLEALESGRPLALGGRKQRALLGMLALNANEVVTIDRLVEEIWSGSRPEAAAHSLQVTISNLRRALGDVSTYLETRPGGYSLALPGGALDAERFEQLFLAGRRAREEGALEQATGTLREALSLWRGDAFADLAYEPFVQAEAARLEELRLACAEERIDAELELGRHLQLLPELESRVREQPLRERLRGQLMLALYRSGRHADALAVYRDARHALVEELGLEPSPELRALEAAILRQDATLAVEPPELQRRRHLPALATPLIGRRREVDEVVALLRNDARIVTLTGTGGTGKTRVGLQAAFELADHFADGVYFVGLAALRDAALVPSTIARTLRVEESAGRPLFESLADHLREQRLLLVLDNFEHLDEAAPVLSELLAAAPHTKALVTSRARLRLYGEHEYPVPPLALEGEALPLFAARAQAVKPGFRLSRESTSAAREICLHLDCLPLAIELVAARSDELSPGELLPLLARRLELAAAGPRDLPARQQTLRATIDWSHELLSQWEQTVFARLAVFDGGCTLEAAREVCEADLAVLASLVEKGLVVEKRAEAGAEVRLWMLETIREYALERLEAGGEAESVSRRHAAHHLGLGERADVALAAGGDTAEWLERLETDHDNMRAALDWAARAGEVELELRLAVTLGRFWEWRGHVREGLERLDRALERAHDVPGTLRARALLRTGVFAHMRADFARAEAWMREALGLAQKSGADEIAANALRDLGALAKDTGNHPRAQALHEEARAISDAIGDRSGVSSSLINLADVALARGDYDRAEELARESVLLARELGHELREQMSLLNLGFACLHRGDETEARATLREAARLAHGLGYKEGLAVGLEGLAALDAGAGEAVRAARLMGAAEALLEAAGAVLESGERELHERTLAAVLAQIDQRSFEDAWHHGRSLSPDEAEEAARAADAPGSARGNGPSPVA